MDGSPAAGRASKLLLPLMQPRLCAGFPSPAQDWLEGPIDLQGELVPRPASTFLWEVDGDSMRDAGIWSGDPVIVDRSLTPRDGDVVVALVDGAASLKRLRLAGGQPRLECANAGFPAYRLAEDQDAMIWGVATWCLRRLRRR